MLTWEQTEKLYETAQNTSKSGEQRVSDIQDFMREWGALVNSRSMLPTNHATYEIPTIDPYKASGSKGARPDFPDFGVEGPKWYQNNPNGQSLLTMTQI